MDNYYDTIADSYDELYREEQFEKVSIVKKHIEIKQKYKLLDVGCGNAFYLDGFNCECTGIDPSEKLLSLLPKEITPILFGLDSSSFMLSV